MSVSHKPFVIIDIIPMQKAEMSAMGMTFMKNPDLDMYRVVAVLKSYIEKTAKGRKFLEKLGHGEKMSELNEKYLEFEDAFKVMLPVTSKTINMDKFHVGGEIMVAYYPTNVWATFHAKGEKPNYNDYKRMEE